MENFPSEIIIMLFKYEKPISILKNYSLVCHHWNNLCNDNQLWSFFCHLQQKKIHYGNLPSINSKKQLYKILMEKHLINIYKENAINSLNLKKIMPLLNSHVDNLKEIWCDHYRKIIEKKEIKFYKYSLTSSLYKYLYDEFTYKNNYELYSFNFNFILKQVININNVEISEEEIKFIPPDKPISIENNKEFLIFQPELDWFLNNFLFDFVQIDQEGNMEPLIPK